MSAIVVGLHHKPDQFVREKLDFNHSTGLPQVEGGYRQGLWPGRRTPLLAQNTKSKKLKFKILPMCVRPQERFVF